MFVNQVGDFALNSWDYGLFGKCFFFTHSFIRSKIKNKYSFNYSKTKAINEA